MPEPSPHLYRHLLVATGGAPHSQKAVERAVQIARHYGATLHVVTVVPQGGSTLMNAAVAFPGAETFEAQALIGLGRTLGLRVAATGGLMGIIGALFERMLASVREDVTRSLAFAEFRAPPPMESMAP